METLQARQLRIGNLVNFAEDGVIFEVVGVSNDGLYVKNSEEETYIEMELFEPIPLTEECLVRFGFEFINNEFYRSQNSELCLYLTVNKNKMIPEYNGKRLVTGYDFKHVHQLQNLYFALTGEELTLKTTIDEKS